MPAPAQFRLNLFGRLVYGAMLAWFRRGGWRAEGQLRPARKFILVGAPHTSNWDFLVFVGTIAEFGKQVRFIGKHPLFRCSAGRSARWCAGSAVCPSIAAHHTIWSSKCLTIGPVVHATGDYERDMAPAFALFRTLAPKHPERGYIPPLA